MRAGRAAAPYVSLFALAVQLWINANAWALPAAIPAPRSPQNSRTTAKYVEAATSAVGGSAVPCSASPENCNPPDGASTFTSDRSNFRTADNFSTFVTGSVTTACWWGAYVDATGADCAGTALNAFDIRYFADLGGAPGALIASFSQSAGTLNVVGPVPTGATVETGHVEYAFQGTHAPVPVNSAVQYWIEISNTLPGCTWSWSTSGSGDGRAVQDGMGPPNATLPNGFGLEDVIGNDLAFCLNVPLPAPPANNACEDAEAIGGTGEFLFDNRFASTDGPPHAACDVYTDDHRQVAHDVWSCWTSPCTGTALVRTCGLTDVDTRVAVYQGCSCSPTNANLVACDDDFCGRDSDTQSMASFWAVSGASYLVRVGTYPSAVGGAGSFEILCGPPDEPACGGSNTASCCDPHASGGCGDTGCCESVCACDPFCCEVAWDDACAGLGFHDSGCGAEGLCNCKSACGAPESGDCCAGTNTPGCSDRACCEKICACDPYCCQIEWDDACATTGSKGDCGAAILCSTLCNPLCPQGTIRWLDAPAALFDARRPHPRGSTSPAEGLQTLRFEAPDGFNRLECWTICESATLGAANRVASILRDADRTFTLTLARPITRGAVTRVSYRDDLSQKQFVELTSHPGNADADLVAGAGDVAALRSEFEGIPSLPPGPQRRDIDRSGLPTPADLLELIDLLNGTSAYTPWNGTSRPTLKTACP